MPIAPQKIRFRYRLEGYDEAWQDAGTRRQAFYTNLAHGNYRFHVTASSSDGVWSDTGATLGFVIPPTFYQTRWFAVLYTSVSPVISVLPSVSQASPASSTVLRLRS